MGPRVLVVDNYDSFVYNLVQELGELGADPVVFRNDAIDVAGIRAASPDAVLISPGPGRPDDGGVSLDVVRQLGGEAPQYFIAGYARFPRQSIERILLTRGLNHSPQRIGRRRPARSPPG